MFIRSVHSGASLITLTYYRLGPTINIHRSPLGGRGFECLSEDPVLSGKLAASIIKGLQDNGIAACPKVS